MARPQTKDELITAANHQFADWFKRIDSLNDTVFHTPFDFSDYPKLTESHWQRDKNIRDVLIHLYEWHQLLIAWIDRNQSGVMSDFLPKPYNWRTIAEMNATFWEKHQQTPYDDAVKLLQNSHQQVMQLIDTFSNEELFTKKYFAWTGSTSLGSYCVSATSSHYDWAIKKLKKHQQCCS